jgi:hypothetical protein
MLTAPAWSNTGLPEKRFTLEEANAALAEVRPLAERMVEVRRELTETTAKLERRRLAVAGNGGGLSVQETQEFQELAVKQGMELARCIEAIAEIGAQVKDLDRGLLDFPAQRDGEDILLCWHVGEDEIRYWHGLDEGFAGRKPLG